MNPFKALVVASFLFLTACGDQSLIVTRNNVDIPLPPEAILIQCPQDVEKVIPVNGRSYTEEEVATVAERNRIAYVSCRNVVNQINKLYINMKATAAKYNTESK